MSEARLPLAPETRSLLLLTDPLASEILPRRHFYPISPLLSERGADLGVERGQAEPLRVRWTGVARYFVPNPSRCAI